MVLVMQDGTLGRHLDPAAASYGATALCQGEGEKGRDPIPEVHAAKYGQGETDGT